MIAVAGIGQRRGRAISGTISTWRAQDRFGAQGDAGSTRTIVPLWIGASLMPGLKPGATTSGASPAEGCDSNVAIGGLTLALLCANPASASAGPEDHQARAETDPARRPSFSVAGGDCSQSQVEPID